MDKATAPKEKEVELKYRVKSSDDLDRIASAAGATQEQVLRQINTFFDTDTFDLNKNKFTIRLRKENRKYLLGAKSPAVEDVGGIATGREEREIGIAPDLAEKIIQGTANPISILHSKLAEAKALVDRIMSVLGGKKVRNVGSFVNFRTTFVAKLPEAGTQKLEMDTTIFAKDTVHYEIEIEEPKGDTERAKAIAVAMAAIFKEAGVDYRPGPPKAQRFFNMAEGKPIE